MTRMIATSQDRATAVLDHGGTPDLHTKLKMSKPGDASEHEADRAAKAATRQDQTRTGGSGTETEPALRQPIQANNNSGEAIRLPGTGQPLPDSVRRFFESRFGKDLSRVRIHNDKPTAESANALNARAYTIGHDIGFAAGEYTPETTEGKGLLAHELAHVLQQDKSRVPCLQRKTKGEELVDKANVFLATDADLKVEVDVLKAAIREVKKGKSVDFNKKAGLKKVEKAAAILKLDVKKTTALKSDWEWLVDNHKKASESDYRRKEKSFFKELRSPIDVIDDKYPKEQTKFWLKNTAAQIVDIILAVANADMPADQLFAYANKEGLIDYVRGEIGLGKTASPTASQLTGVSTTKKVSGFEHFGLDDFMTELTEKREPLSGYLPKGYDLTKVQAEDRENEKKRIVYSGIFPNLTMALQALAAMLKRRRKLFREDAKADKYATPTTDELVYWTYVYFNSGEFGGKAQLDKYKGKRTLSDWITKGEFPNAIKLLQSYQMLKDMKLF